MSKVLVDEAVLQQVLEQPEQEPVKRWPFVETPEQFSNRLFEAIREFSSILPAVRHVLIENPPMFTHPPRREYGELLEALKGMFDQLDLDGCIIPAVLKARAAIARAEGNT
jgi:hypothetical protein